MQCVTACNYYNHDNRYIIIRAFVSGHIGRYRQPGEDPTNYRYRNVILTNALGGEQNLESPQCLASAKV